MINFKEDLADLEHQQWIHWTKYLIENYNLENKERWRVQTQTKYKDLSEKEKDSDRTWADKVIKLIRKNDVALAEFLSCRLEYSPELIGDLIKEFREKND